MAELAGKTVLIAGATSASGRAVARALLDAGARVVAVGSDDGRIRELEAELPGVIGERADLTDGDDVLELAMRVHARVGDVDGVIHLVGGWRGGGGIPGQTDEDYRVVERSFTALRYASRAFWDDVASALPHSMPMTLAALAFLPYETPYNAPAAPPGAPIGDAAERAMPMTACAAKWQSMELRITPCRMPSSNIPSSNWRYPLPSCFSTLRFSSGRYRRSSL